MVNMKSQDIGFYLDSEQRTLGLEVSNKSICWSSQSDLPCLSILSIGWLITDPILILLILLCWFPYGPFFACCQSIAIYTDIFNANTASDSTNGKLRLLQGKLSAVSTTCFLVLWSKWIGSTDRRTDRRMAVSFLDKAYPSLVQSILPKDKWTTLAFQKSFWIINVRNSFSKSVLSLSINSRKCNSHNFF